MPNAVSHFTPAFLTGALSVVCGFTILANPVSGQEPEPIEAGLAPTSLPYAPGLDVLHYDFELSLSESDESFLGRARVRLALVEPLPDAIVLDLTGLAVEAVRLDGREDARVGVVRLVEVRRGWAPRDC